jgi:hypothetical protein
MPINLEFEEYGDRLLETEISIEYSGNFITCSQIITNYKKVR